jgi:hypothetical protein
LFRAPTRVAAAALRVRTGIFGREIAIENVPAHDPPHVAAIFRVGDLLRCESWPDPTQWRAYDRVMIAVEPNEADRRRFIEFVRGTTHAPEGASLAPFCREPAGIHSLWCIAVARVLLPGHVHVEARHDLLGIHIAQLALGFGADLLSGPIEPDRKLPLAGVPRPTEATRDGLFTLVRQAGLSPVDSALPHRKAHP